MDRTKEFSTGATEQTPNTSKSIVRANQGFLRFTPGSVNCTFLSHGVHNISSLLHQGQGTRVSRESHLLLHEGLDYGAANCILVSQVLNASCSI